MQESISLGYASTSALFVQSLFSAVSPKAAMGYRFLEELRDFVQI